MAEAEHLTISPLPRPLVSTSSKDQLIRVLTLLLLFLTAPPSILCHTCGNNRIPYGIEIHRNGQPALLCSRPNCFDKTYADCDERAMRSSCDSNTTWVGGFDKSLGEHQPLYVQCCEFEQLPLISQPLYSGVVIRPGEYFEGEEITDKFGEEVLAFDLITNLKRIRDANSTTSLYQIDVRRFHCSQMIRPKRYKPWHWP